MISFDLSKTEFDIIDDIVRRARRDFPASIDGPTAVRVLTMDIAATHANGCRLRLLDFLAAPRFDFAHDIFGIRRHINRETGKLEGCFLPRYADLAKCVAVFALALMMFASPVLAHGKHERLDTVGLAALAKNAAQQEMVCTWIKKPGERFEPHKCKLVHPDHE